VVYVSAKLASTTSIVIGLLIIAVGGYALRGILSRTLTGKFSTVTAAMFKVKIGWKLEV